MHRGSPASHAIHDDEADRTMHLSKRQKEVLALVAEGATDNEIAIQLGLSAKTISSYVKHIRTRFGAQSRAHAVALAIRQGLLADSDSTEEEI